MKKALALLLTIICGAMLCGCTNDVDSIEKSIENKQAYYEEIIDLLEDSEWVDNSLDSFYADLKYDYAINIPEKVDAAGGTFVAITSSQAILLKKWLFEDYKDNWDEKYTVDLLGNSSTEIVGSIRTKPVFNVGAVVGTNAFLVEYLGLRTDGNQSYTIGVIGEQGVVSEEIELKTGENLSIIKLMMDSDGSIHIINYNGSQYEYLVFDHDGMLVYKKEGNYVNLYAMYDGGVGVTEYSIEEGSNSLIYDCITYNTMAKTTEIIGAIKASYRGLRGIICPKKGLIIYADDEGIFKVNGESSIPIYLWAHHGIVDTQVLEMQSYEEDVVTLMCVKDDLYTSYFLKPTVEMKGIKTVEIVTTPEAAYKYREAVATFNRMYPQYNIEVVTEYDDIKLRTLLISGDGPTIIDTSVIDFSSNSELWMDLGPIWNKLGKVEELNDAIINLGTIDGKLKGIVTEFRIETLITAGKETKNWTYEKYLKEAILSSDKVISSSNDGYENYSYVLAFLMRNENDSYLFDAEKVETYFDRRDFLTYIEKIKKNDSVKIVDENGHFLQSGDVLVARASITRPEDYLLYQMKYQNNISYSGYPSRNGGVHIIKPEGMLSIRRNATNEEIAIACKFFDLLLSYDMQKTFVTNTKRCLSVRKDVLAEQVDIIGYETKASKWNIEETTLGDVTDNWDKEGFYELINVAIPEYGDMHELSEIIKEELIGYFDGIVSEEKMVENLSSRVELYLMENQ